MEDFEDYPELTRAALPQAVLSVLSHGENHGYAIAEALRRHGFTRIKGGTLYPLLKRLEEQKLTQHLWTHEHAGPPRKLFKLTPQGEAELQRAEAAWAGMMHALSEIRTTSQEKS
ncbi:PadR family transcriptional regulator [Glutamicibacter protophormiae]